MTWRSLMADSFAELLERENRSPLKRAVGAILSRSAIHVLRGWWYRWRFTHRPEQVRSHLKVIGHLVSPGDIVVDLGANIGQYTFLLSRLVGREGRVIAFEPVQSTHELLSRNLRAHRVVNADLRKCAISSQRGTATMEIPRFAWGGDAHYLAHIVSAPSISEMVESVPCDTVDGALGEFFAKVTFVKCDIEGHEVACLQGASRFLRSTPAAWLMEVAAAERPGSQSEAFDIMRSFGYTPWTLEGNSLVACRTARKTSDVFFFLPSHLMLLAHRDPMLLQSVAC